MDKVNYESKPSKPASKKVSQSTKNNKKTAKKLKPEHQKIRKTITLLIIILELFLIYALYTSNLGILLGVGIGILSLILSGIIITKVNNLSGNFGLYIYGGSSGISTIEKISKFKREFWIFLSEWGLVMSFGVLSYFIFKGRVSKKAVFIGLISIAFIIVVMLPYFLLSFQYIKIPNLPSISMPQGVTGISQLSLFGYILLLISLVGGFSIFLFIELLAASGLMIANIFTVASSIASSSPNYTALSTATPGLAPLIPGITIPFFAGILSLAVILIVHEFSHGILSGVYKIKIKKIGLALFGILPIGAFVEPDEKAVVSSEKYVQNNIFIAGISANFLLTFIFFIFVLLFLLYIIPNIYTNGLYISAVAQGSPAYNVIAPGSLIVAWNNMNVSNVSQLDIAAKSDLPSSIVTVKTNETTYKIRANSTGKIGVYIQEYERQKGGVTSSILVFLYQFLVLSLVLNFLVATINLLPIPLFDGWRIYKNTIKSERKLKLLVALVIIMFVLLALPWLFISL
ncbi:MAG: site-2 protease family protein [Candidatus Micrarchaeia archaeon]